MWANYFLKTVDNTENSWILSLRNAQVTARHIHHKRSARLPYVHHDVATNRGGLLALEVVVVRTTSWRESVLHGRSRVRPDRSRVYARIDALH